MLKNVVLKISIVYMAITENDVILFLKNVLNKCNIVFDEFKVLDGITIPRNILMDTSVLDTIKPDIQRLKTIFSSSSMTSLHKNASTKQKFPVLNLVRQILNSLNYKMVPIRISNGYSNEGKKQFTRYFNIVKCVV